MNLNFEECKRVLQQGRPLCSFGIYDSSDKDLTCFKDFSLEFMNTQTQKSAPIQCAVWPLNGFGSLVLYLKQKKKLSFFQTVFVS